MKLNVRMIYASEKKNIQLDILSGEFAKLNDKYYYDKTKLILAGKCHLNLLIKFIPSSSPEGIKSISNPLIQVMSMNIHVYSLSLIDKNLYLVQKIAALHYPRTLNQIKTSGIKTLIDGFSLLKVSSLLFLKKKAHVDD
jgi:hypothetical protein